MVCRLVKQQHIGFLQQNLCQFDAHTPSSGELRGWPVEVAAHEAQSLQRAFHHRLVLLAAHHEVAFVQRREPLYESHIVFCLVVSPLSHLALHVLESPAHPDGFGERLARLVAHGGVVLQLHHLRQIAHRGGVGYGDGAARRLLYAAQNLQQRRFAGTVLADKGYAVAVVDDERDMVVQRRGAELYEKVFN